MSEQKPKIDLKARLGKKTASSPGPGGSIPPPTAQQPQAHGMPVQGMGGPAMQRPMQPMMQRPSGAPAVSPSGIPAPPFAQQPSRQPPVDPSNPYGGSMQSPAAAPARPQQAIRIEMGEEVVEAQRRGRKKVLVLLAIVFAIGGGVGFTAGGGAERGKGADAAIAGAQELIKEIEKSNAEVVKLADVLKSAKEKLSKGQYPDDEVSKLGSINIPFSGKNLAGKGIGRFKPEIVSMLIEYAGSTTEANSQKEKVQNVLTGAKKGLMELLAESSKPQVRWSVILVNGPNGPWGSMQALPTPFPAKDKWPEDLKVGSGKQQQTFKRYSSGNPINSESPFYIPVDPTTQSGVCPSDTIFKLRRELNDLETVMRGDNSPGEERAGLIDAARQLTEKLKQIGRTS
jgi:hypothetical protein